MLKKYRAGETMYVNVMTQDYIWDEIHKFGTFDGECITFTEDVHVVFTENIGVYVTVVMVRPVREGVAYTPMTLEDANRTRARKPLRCEIENMIVTDLLAGAPDNQEVLIPMYADEYVCVTLLISNLRIYTVRPVNRFERFINWLVRKTS